MSDTQHTVYFEGNIADGFSIGQVKKNLVKLFKSDAERIGQLFSGERVALKKNIDLATANKYHAVLLNAGAMVTIAAANDAATDNAEAPPAAQEKATQKEEPKYSWSLAPVGSLLLKATEKIKQAVVNIDISHLSLVSVFAAEKKTKAAEDAAAPDVSHLSVAPVGERLVQSRKTETVELALDLSAFSVEPVGADLGNGATTEVAELQLDLRAYVLLDLGEETSVTRSPQAPSPEPPDVSHLALLPEAEPVEDS